MLKPHAHRCAPGALWRTVPSTVRGARAGDIAPESSSAVRPSRPRRRFPPAPTSSSSSPSNATRSVRSRRRSRVQRLRPRRTRRVVPHRQIPEPSHLLAGRRPSPRSGLSSMPVAGTYRYPCVTSFTRTSCSPAVMGMPSVSVSRGCRSRTTVRGGLLADAADARLLRPPAPWSPWKVFSAAPAGRRRPSAVLSVLVESHRQRLAVHRRPRGPRPDVGLRLAAVHPGKLAELAAIVSGRPSSVRSGAGPGVKRG